MNALAEMMGLGLTIAHGGPGGSRLSAADAEAAVNREEDPRSAFWIHLFAEQWAHCGFPRVLVGHRHAAALMATHTQPRALAGAREPWKYFAIDVPVGLVEMDYGPNGAFPVKHVFVASCGSAERPFIALLFADAERPRMIAWHLALEDLGSAPAEHGRAGEVLARLVLGVCLEMTEHRPAEMTAPGTLLRRDSRGEPQTAIFRLTRDVKVDCRDEVRAYVRGFSTSAPRVRSLIRGHWKSQRCGTGGADRKWIFVEPYWRGPADGPVALRPHALRTGALHV